MNHDYVYKINGNYFGFIKDGLLFSRDGEHLGWVEGQLVWDLHGKFRGLLFKPREDESVIYIIRDRLSMPPITRPPKQKAGTIPPPPSPDQLKPITLPVQTIDAFE